MAQAKKKAPKGWTGESINLDDVSTEPPPALDAAVYRARIISADPATSKAGGAQIALVLEVHTRFGEPDEGIAAEVAAGKRAGILYDYIGFEGAGLRKLKQVCAETEVAAPKEITEESATVFCTELVDKWVWLRSSLEKIEQGARAGEMGARVNRYLMAAQCAEAAAAMAGNVVPALESADVEASPRRPGKRR